MALSNIFREPRREITEQLIGAVVVLGYGYADYRFGRWVEVTTLGHQRDFDLLIVSMLGGVLGTIVIGGLILYMHWIGEGICDRLARRGLELRPKRIVNLR
jgi:hypothetical protein